MINDFLIYPLQHPSPINPYGVKFNISALKYLIQSDKYKQRLGFGVFLDKHRWQWFFAVGINKFNTWLIVFIMLYYRLMIRELIFLDCLINIQGA